MDGTSSDLSQRQFHTEHPEALPLLKQWFENEWELYYSSTCEGSAEKDLLAFSSQSKLPIGVVAYMNGELCGIMALKAQSIVTHSHLRPWAAAGLVECMTGAAAELVGCLTGAAAELVD